MHIGNHQINGKKVNLKNPIMLCKKFKDNGISKMKIVNIIKSKIYFSSRPTPIISKEEVKQIPEFQSLNNKMNEV
jgi:hypothetical protein